MGNMFLAPLTELRQFQPDGLECLLVLVGPVRHASALTALHLYEIVLRHKLFTSPLRHAGY